MVGTSDISGDAITYVNGVRRVLPPACAEKTLLQYLRETGLTGTKLGCGEGGCGACTVMVSSWQGGKIVHRAVNACLAPIYSVEGCHVVTVEGIGNPRDGLHPVQERLAKAHGSQCGFCTPGFVMSMYALLRSHGQEGKPITEADIEASLGGNLCRCTGYRPILDAFRVFAKTDAKAYTEEAIAAASGGTPNGDANGNGVANGSGAANGDGNGKICPSTGRPCDCGASKSDGPSDVKAPSNRMRTAKLGQAKGEPIFPGELKKRPQAELVIPGPNATWMRPVSLLSLLTIKAKHNDAKLIVGNTEVGIEMKFKAMKYPVLVGTTHVPELNEVAFSEDGVTFGASTTLSNLMDTCKHLIATRPAHQTSTCHAIINQLHWFAGTQIRNTASIGGNVCTGSPISDLNPIWMAAGAVFTVAGEGSGEREVPASKFFISYRKVDMQPHEILKSVFLPFTRQFEYVKEYKQAHRREDDIAIVTSGMRMRLEPSPEGWKIAEAHFAFGGVAPKTVMAEGTAVALAGKPLTEATLQEGLTAVLNDIQMTPNAPGGMVEFRRSLTASFLFKFFVHSSLQLQTEAGQQAEQPKFETPFPPETHSASSTFQRPPAHGTQYYFEGVPDDIVGEPRRHLAADLQVSGEAKYTDDVQLPADALHGALLFSKKPHAKLLKVDASKALELEGVAGFFSAKDVPYQAWGPVVKDEVVFADRVVTAVGMPIGIVVASTPDIARDAVRQIVVEYEDLPALMSCEEVAAANDLSLFYTDHEHSIVSGDVEAAFAGCDHVLEGEVKMGGQEHFYLEPHASLVIPQEEDEYLCISSTQAPTKHQQVIAGCLQIPASKVVSKTKRLGGGFGGKETRGAFGHVAAAIAAYHTGKAVSVVFDRDEDMQGSGQRHAFMAKYKVGFSSAGKLVALDADLYSNAGNTLDLSASIMDRALLHIDNSYKIPNVAVRGHLCKTNQATNTAFRGFGGPQGMMVIEQVVERVAVTVGRTAEAVRETNFYQEGELTHYGQKLDRNQVQACWSAAMEQAGGLAGRAEAVAAFNAAHRYRKRGLAATPTKFGISFTALMLNQAGALVHLYTDGTCLVTHGGVEMGQGLHTKMAQIAAQSLSIPLANVFVSETSTDKVPNSSPTAASASSDMYGAAVLDACDQLATRLAPYRAKMPEASIRELANAAWLDRVDLCAHGFYKTPDVTGFGGTFPFNYFCFGSSVSEVELDTLTGDFHVLRTDIVMDVGNPINPAIDIGQVEGGFVQGLGWLCIEELVWGDKQHVWVPPGHLFTKGPGTYKIPSVNDIPIDFRVALLQNAPNPRAVHSSKAVGEPPFHLAASVFCALKEAVYAARKDAGLSGWFQMHSPATPERLRMACTDMVTESVAPSGVMPYISC
eukprot:jgi/Tetstr1/455430/TSEL_042261.t1